VGAICSSQAQDTKGSFGIYSQIIFWRFILGIGIGGEYPLSAAITSETSSSENEAKNLAMVFSMQGFGQLFCSLILVWITQTLGDDYDLQWRLALLIGAIPMATAFYFRWKMHETSWKDESAQAQINQSSDAADKHAKTSGGGVQRICAYCSDGYRFVSDVLYTNRHQLYGTAGSWFILDIVFYANGLFSGQVTASMGFGKTPKQESIAALILNLISLPGYICTILMVDRISLKQLQLMSFFMTAFFFVLLAILQPYLIQVPVLYVMVYGCTFFFQNFGANPTTYIIPSVVYSTAHRATCHGVSAAAGKLGALIGAQTMLYLFGAFCSNDSCDDDQDSRTDINRGLQVTFSVCAFLAIVGGAWTKFMLVDHKAIVKNGKGDFETDMTASLLSPVA